MTEKQTYLMKVAIAGLSGGLAGGLLGQYVVENPTMGKTIMGSVLGAAAIGAGYGLYLRTGGEGGAAHMAGLDLSTISRLGQLHQAKMTRPTVSGCRQVGGCKGQYPPRFGRIYSNRSRMSGLGQCYEITPM